MDSSRRTKMKIYGIIVNGGDGSYSMSWYRSKKVVEQVLNDDNNSERYALRIPKKRKKKKRPLDGRGVYNEIYWRHSR